jgi:hypothetical protein
MSFAKKTLKCMGCKAALPPGQSTLCKHCKGKEAELYIKSLQVVRADRYTVTACLVPWEAHERAWHVRCESWGAVTHSSSLGAVSSTWRADDPTGSGLRELVDTVPAVSGLTAPRRALHQPRLPHLLPKTKGAEGAQRGACEHGTVHRLVILLVAAQSCMRGVQVVCHPVNQASRSLRVLYN